MKQEKGKEGGRLAGLALTDMGDSYTSRRELKGRFLAKDRTQTDSYVKDLEQTLAINKQIINDLLGQSGVDAPSKKVIEKLNAESSAFQGQLKRAVKERNDLQAKLLISEQIIEDCNAKERELAKDYEEKSTELIDQLNRKEFFLQNSERRLSKTLTLLKKLAHTNPEIRLTLHELNAEPKDERRIANVVEENKKLNDQLKAASADIQHLQDHIAALVQANAGLETQLKQLRTEEDLRKRRKCEVPRLKLASGNSLETTADKERIAQLEDELVQLQKKVDDLYKLNVSLTDALAQANEKLSNLREHRPKTPTGQSKSSLSCLRATVEVPEGALKLKASARHPNNFLELDFNAPTKSARVPRRPNPNADNGKSTGVVHTETSVPTVPSHSSTQDKSEPAPPMSGQLNARVSFGEVILQNESFSKLSNVECESPSHPPDLVHDLPPLANADVNIIAANSAAH